MFIGFCIFMVFYVFMVFVVFVFFCVSKEFTKSSNDAVAHITFCFLDLHAKVV